MLSVAEITEQLNAFLDKSRSNNKLVYDSDLRQLSEAARKVGLATEAQGDTVHRIAHAVSIYLLVVLMIAVKPFEQN